MIWFGPSGNSDQFYEEGYKSTWQAAKWLSDMGLNAYEYSFGRGVNIGREGAEKIAGEMRARGLKVSAHAPYFINLANPDPEKRAGSYRYILESAQAVKWLGGTRIVIHVGAEMKQERQSALKLCREGIAEAFKRLDDHGLGDVTICPETMGKRSQIGNLRETCDFCLMDERMIPCIDFAHLHALTGGGLKETEDFAKLLDELESVLGAPRARKIHVHFSTIEYTAAGEKRHHTFAEPEYGPRFELLAPLFKERAYEPTVICESKNTMAEDAREMSRIYAALPSREE